MSLLMALPKGRLLDEVKELFKKIDIEFDTNSRKLIIDSSEEWLKFAVLRTWDIPKFVNYGAADIGIVGKDILFESKLENNFYELLNLSIGKCRMSLASLEKKIPNQKKSKLLQNILNFQENTFRLNQKILTY